MTAPSASIRPTRAAADPASNQQRAHGSSGHTTRLPGASLIPRQLSIRQGVVAAAHVVYVVGHNAKEKVKHAFPPTRRNTADSERSNSPSSASGGYPNNALSDEDLNRPHSWPRITPRAPRIAAASSSSTLLASCTAATAQQNGSRRPPVSARDIRKFVKAFPSAAPASSSTADETLEAAYPCALSREDGLWHGTMFLTTHRLCFAGALFTKGAKLAIEYSDIFGIEKTTTHAILPNALQIAVTSTAAAAAGEFGKELLLFAAFVGRDDAYCDVMNFARRRRLCDEDQATAKRSHKVTFADDTLLSMTRRQSSTSTLVDASHPDIALTNLDDRAEPAPASDSPAPDAAAATTTSTTCSSTLCPSLSYRPPRVVVAPPAEHPRTPPPSEPAKAFPLTTTTTTSVPLHASTRSRERTIAIIAMLLSLSLLLLLVGLVTAALNVSRLAALTTKIDRAAALAAAAAKAISEGQ
ncbi:hypothetical protein HDU86_002531 [Geranomyces michiganensis]|nr:hypothetical protein HDU86_002531 [Geranomyces michiganensis]